MVTCTRGDKRHLCGTVVISRLVAVDGVAPKHIHENFVRFYILIIDWVSGGNNADSTCAKHNVQRNNHSKKHPEH
jgi:hypothetical protein